MGRGVQTRFSEPAQQRVRVSSGMHLTDGQVAELLLLLSEHEWSTSGHCHECEGSRAGGHEESCRWAAAMRLLGGRVPA